MKFNKKHFLFLIGFILFLIAITVHCALTRNSAKPDRIVMTAKQRDVTLSAFEFVKEEISNGRIKTPLFAKKALYAELPLEIRDAVIIQLDKIAIEQIPAKLDQIANSIIISEITLLYRGIQNGYSYV